jgi:hypothetical protein
MAQTLQYDQAALIAGLQTARATDIQPVPRTPRSGGGDAITSLRRWYKISVRPRAMNNLADIPIPYAIGPTLQMAGRSDGRIPSLAQHSVRGVSSAYGVLTASLKRGESRCLAGIGRFKLFMAFKLFKSPPTTTSPIIPRPK